MLLITPTVVAYLLATIVTSLPAVVDNPLPVVEHRVPAIPSSATFGKTDGETKADTTMKNLQCARGRYVTSITAVVSDQIRGIKIKCSNGFSPDYAGIDKLEDVPQSEPGVYSSKSKSVKKVLENPSGFSNLMFNLDLGDKRVVGMKSFVQELDLQLLPDLAAKDGNFTGNVWPTHQDSATHASSNSSLILAGFDVWSDTTNGVVALLPYFHVVAGKPKPNVFAKAPKRLSGDIEIDTSIGNQFSQAQFGKINRQYPEEHFVCPQGSYINAIASAMTSKLLSLKFYCSDGSNSSCIGACGKNQAVPHVGFSSGPDNLVMKNMSSHNGFDTIEVKTTDQVIAMRSPNTLPNLESDITTKGDKWSVFPNEDDKNTIGLKRIVLVGFYVLYTDHIQWLNPLYAGVK